MQRCITGIDINDGFLTAVRVRKGLGRWEVVACGRVAMENEEGLDQGLSTLSRTMNLTGGECVVTVPGADTHYRNLTVPFREKRKQRDILPFELEPNVPFPIEDLVIDFFSVNGSGAPELLAFFAEKRAIGRLLASCRAHGIDPEVLCVRCIPMAMWLLNIQGTPPNGILLELGERRVSLVLWQKKQVALIRTFIHADGAGPVPDKKSAMPNRLVNAVRRTVHAFGAGRKEFAPPEKVFLTGRDPMFSTVSRSVTEAWGIPAERVDLCRDDRIRLGETARPLWDPSRMDGALSLALGYYGGKGLGPNLRRNEFAVRKRSFYHSRRFRKVALWLLVIGALWGVDLGVEVYFLKQRAAALDSRILALFKETFPHIRRIVDPVRQAQIEINELKRVSTPVAGVNGKALDVLLEISERLPESMDLKVARLVIDPNAVRIKGDTDTFNTVDRAKQGLEKSSLFKTTTISSANLDRVKNRVLFEIKLGR